MSFWRRQRRAVMVAPISLSLINSCFRGVSIMFMFSIIKIPKAPSFRSTPARIIEPATGASTWAFGNH